MTHVEIYKLKKTVEPKVRDYGMFEFFGMVDGPLPKNYVKEFAGELSHGMLSDILGRTFVDPPEGYKGGPLEKGDIIVADSQAYFLDREPSGKFVFAHLNFDTSLIKDAIHVEYGKYVGMNDAVQIPRTFAIVCESLDIPIGYLGEPGYHGSDKGISSFDRSSSDQYAPCYLHPQFLKGEEGKEFISLLTELSSTDRWDEIAGHLRENYPVYTDDLKAARLQFAPELLLPESIRSLHKHIPADADQVEIAYLAAEVEALSAENRELFDAVTEVGLHCGSIAEIINLTKTLDCYELHHSLNEGMYGELMLESDWDCVFELVDRFEKSQDPNERVLAQYISHLNRAVDSTKYGQSVAKESGEHFTSLGMIRGGIGEPRTVYCGIQDIPDDFRQSLPAPKAQETEINSTRMDERAALGNGDKPSVLTEIAEHRETVRNKPPKQVHYKSDIVTDKKKSDPDL